MKVREMIEMLQAHPENEEVFFALDMIDDDKIIVVSIDDVYPANIGKEPILIMISNYTPPVIENLN